MRESLVHITTNNVVLEGNLAMPAYCQGIVLFAHGSGSSRFSVRNRFVADALHKHKLATLLIDLLTQQEEAIDRVTRHLRFDISLLTERLTGAVDWLTLNELTQNLRIGLFGASTGAAAAIRTAALRPDAVRTIVSRGGRPDLAGQKALHSLRVPGLFLVGGQDTQVITLNQQAIQLIQAPIHLSIIPGATHLFSEPGALENVAEQAANWFSQYLNLPAQGDHAEVESLHDPSI